MDQQPQLLDFQAAGQLGLPASADLANWQLSQRLQAGQNRVLEMIATGAALNDVLQAIALLIEQQSTGDLCSILLLDAQTRRLHCGAAPSLAAAYNAAIEGLEIGPSVGSCGTAAHSGQRVIVADIATDPRWAEFKDLALGHGLRACWSQPIIARDGAVLGTVANYARTPATPNSQHLELLEAAAHLAGIAIERQRADAERDRLLESERSARAQAERAGRVKDEFLATLSHELRTPLNAILGWAQLLRNGPASPDRLEEGLSIIERNARVQTSIIEDLLDMSRIISGKLRLDVRRVDLSEVIEAALEAVRPPADARGVRLEKVLDPLAGPVNGDPNRLQQVVWNLLSNSIKFTPRGGRVQVLLERVNSHVEITVSDTGVGIKPEFLPLVFDRFIQGDASTTRKHGGLGLGLSIVKNLVEMHGGSIRAKSPGEGKGATFIVMLPLPIVHDPPSPGPREHPRAGAGSIADPLAIDLAGLRILMVDDEPDARLLGQRILEGCGAAVTTASCCADALRLLDREHFDVVISDIGMPDRDGYELIASLRGLPDERGGRTPAVALTAFARSEDRRRAMLAGFDMHLAKPVEPAELVAVVARMARRAGR